MLKLCRAEACQAAGGDALAARAEAKLGIGSRQHHRQRARDLLEPIYYPGLCATAPSAMPDSRVVGRLDEARSMRWSRGAAMTIAHFGSA